MKVFSQRLQEKEELALKMAEERAGLVDKIKQMQDNLDTNRKQEEETIQQLAQFQQTNKTLLIKNEQLSLKVITLAWSRTSKSNLKQ